MALRTLVGQLDQWVAGFITGFLFALCCVAVGTAIFLFALFKVG